MTSLTSSSRATSIARATYCHSVRLLYSHFASCLVVGYAAIDVLKACVTDRSFIASTPLLLPGSAPFLRYIVRGKTTGAGPWRHFLRYRRARQPVAFGRERRGWTAVDAGTTTRTDTVISAFRTHTRELMYRAYPTSCAVVSC